MNIVNKLFNYLLDVLLTATGILIGIVIITINIIVILWPLWITLAAFKYLQWI